MGSMKFQTKLGIFKDMYQKFLSTSIDTWKDQGTLRNMI